MRAPRGKEFGRRFLTAEGLSPHDISEFEDALLSARSSEAFVSEIGYSGGLLGELKAEKVAVLWDLYKML